MNFFQTVKLAIKNIKSNKLRSILTMIGIIIGISSVIVLVGMGSGSTKSITSQVQSLGTNLIVANTFSNGTKQLTLDDVSDIQKINGVDKIAPVISSSTSVKVDKNSQNTSVTGTSSNFAEIRNMNVAEGRFIADLDVDYKNKVVVLGSDIAQQLYGLTQLLDTMSSITNTMTYLLGGIAAISLIVGGIGVMNVMLVSVSERTKEIGIRKALGGSRKDILIQFLIEALVLSSLGGVIGVLFGLGIGELVSAFGLSVTFSLPIVAVAFSFSLIVGIVFGIFPAYKASKLKPIDALRFE